MNHLMPSPCVPRTPSLKLRLVTVQVDLVTEDGEIFSLTFNMDPATFQISQHRHLEPLLDHQHETVAFETALVYLNIKGICLPTQEG